MSFPTAPASYDRANEQNFRAGLSRLISLFRRADVAVGFILMTDSVTNQTGRLTIVSGVPTWTAL